MSEQTLLRRVQKLLGLAENNPNAFEAECAALKARELIAKHNLSLTDVEEDNEVTLVIFFELEKARAWKYQLVKTIAESYRCLGACSGVYPVIFGRAKDCAVAKEVLLFLYRIGHKLADRAARLAREKTGSGAGIYNSFVLGFIAGVEAKLAEQAKALMIIVPDDVTAFYREKVTGVKSVSTRVLSYLDSSKQSWEEGFESGQRAIERRKNNVV